MKKYDNNIELFDAYLNNSMNEGDRKAFEKRLADDAALKREFTIHKEMVYLLQKSCSDADREFEQAMKGLSDDEFRKIVSVKESDSASTVMEQPKARMVPLKKVYQWMSAAAVALLLVGIGSNLLWNYKMGDTTAYSVQMGRDFNNAPGLPPRQPDVARGGDEDLEADNFATALTELSNGNFDQGIQMLENLYKNASTQPRKERIGTELIYAYYMRAANDPDAAKRIIERLKKENNGKLPNEPEDIAKGLKLE